MKKLIIICIVILVLWLGVNSYFTGRGETRSEIDKPQAINSNVTYDSFTDGLLKNLPRGWNYAVEESESYTFGVRPLFQISFIFPAKVYLRKNRDGTFSEAHPSFFMVYYSKFKKEEWKKYQKELERFKAHPMIQESLDAPFAETDKYTIFTDSFMYKSVVEYIKPDSQIYEIAQYVKRYYNSFLIINKKL